MVNDAPHLGKVLSRKRKNRGKVPCLDFRKDTN